MDENIRRLLLHAFEVPFDEDGGEPDLAESLTRDDWGTQQGLVSLDAPIGGEWGTTLGDFIVDDTTEPQPDDVDVEVLRERLARALDTLPVHERKVMSLRFGQEDGKPRTLSEICDELGTPAERVRQIETRLLTRLSRTRCCSRIEDLLDD